jgi:hypothetical protein
MNTERRDTETVFLGHEFQPIRSEDEAPDFKLEHSEVLE